MDRNGPYKVLHTFSPSFEMWGVRNAYLKDDIAYHERVAYLAMVEWQPGLRSVRPFSIDNEELVVGPYLPCDKQRLGVLTCGGHGRTAQVR